jgi:hypothetical protein
MRFSGPAIEQMRTQSPGVLAIHGWVTTTTSGTIDTTKSNIPGGGASIVKTGGKTGRYTITLSPPTAESVSVLANLQFLGGWATLVGPPDVAIANSKGVISFFRQDDISQVSPSGTSAKDGTVELQWAISTATAQADTEVADGASFYFAIYMFNPAVQ